MNGYFVLTILILLDDGTRRYFALLHFETATIEIKVFVIVKTFSSTTLAIAFKYLLEKEKELFC